MGTKSRVYDITDADKVTKQYEFTVVEQLAIRDALAERCSTLAEVFAQSPLAQEVMDATKALLDKFEQDVFVSYQEGAYGSRA